MMMNELTFFPNIHKSDAKFVSAQSTYSVNLRSGLYIYISVPLKARTITMMEKKKGKKKRSDEFNI